MKKIIYLLLICFSLHLKSQNKTKAYTFGQISVKELKMTVYEKDTMANAVVLYEHGSTNVENIHSIFLKTTVYRKIKILNTKGNKHADVKIYIYNDQNKSAEKVKKIKAFTYNLNEPKAVVKRDEIYTKTISDNWKEVTFTFPNVKKGSVLEYQYDLESKFFFNFTGWQFQSDIPKIYSEFNASIPGNWRYNRHLNGSLKLFKNEATLKKNCFSIGSRSIADCEELTYAMKNIPAFIEEDNYSTAKSNYLSKIKFELSEIFYPDGTTEKYTTSWKETDKQLKYDESLGRQINLKSYFFKNMPHELFNSKDELARSKAIFKYIQNHFTVNSDKQSIFTNVNVKKAFKEKLGSISEINLALVNALKAAGIEAKIFLLSTRDKGFPTKAHPVMTDFNYVAVYVTIDKKTYLIDASDDFLPFGLLPFETLNNYGRVLDFENGSFWFSIEPKIKTYKRIKTTLAMNDDGTLIGNVQETNNGYFSKFKRELIHDKSEEKYLIDLEDENENLKILSYTNEELDKPENPLVENFEVEISASESIENTIYLNPFIEKYTKNPFQLKQRNYPVNFGFKIKEIYLAKISIPENYTIKSVPKSITFKLPDNGGLFMANFKKEENKITIISRIQLNKTIYKTDEYENLKEFFNQIIKTQNSLITLEKTSTP